MGWAPIPPGVQIRAGMNFASLSIGVPDRFWIFVGGSHFLDPHIRPVVLPNEPNTTIVNYTVVHNSFGYRGNTFVNEGAGIDTVRRITRRDVPQYSVQDSRQPGPTRTVGNAVAIYRPSFAGNPGARPRTTLETEQARRKLAPAKVYEPRSQPPARSPESAVQARQAEERALLETTQSQELKEIQRRGADEARRAQNAAEKARIQQEYRTRACGTGPTPDRCGGPIGTGDLTGVPPGTRRTTRIPIRVRSSWTPR
jgi:hypothetical protein